MQPKKLPRPYAILILMAFIAVGGPALQAQGAAVHLDIKTFPADALVVLETPAGAVQPLHAVSQRDGWRRFNIDGAHALVRVEAPGYLPKWLHLRAAAQPYRLEERLERTRVLELIGELPTGDSPKSVTFTPDGRTLLVPLLRAGGVDRFSVEPFVRLPRTSPADADAAEAGFVESLLLPSHGETWVSQMTNGAIQRFSLDGARHVGRVGAGGQWPKVMIAAPDERSVFVSNWIAESVTVIDPTDGTQRAAIPLSGQPRGMAFTEGGRYLWVCIYSTGDVEIIDTARNAVVERLALGPGAARHIVTDAAQRWLYLSDMYHGTVARIDSQTRRVTARRRVGFNLNTIVLSRDGRYLFVSERGRNNPESYLLRGPEFGRIFVLDAVTLETVDVVYGRHQPTGLDVSPDGRYLAATDFLDHNVVLYRIRTP